MKLSKITDIQSAASPLLVVVATLCLNGCSNIYNGYAAAPLDLKVDHTFVLVTKIKGTMPTSSPCFMDTYTDDKEKTCAGQRNQVISYLMTESGFLCVEHLKSIYGKEAAFNIATGSIATLASGIAAISSAGRASSLSALSSFSNAERSLVNETIYKAMLTSAIATKIQDSRNTKGTALLAKKTQPYGSYRIEDSIYDILDYHQACSFYHGLELALSEGTQTNPASKRALLEIKAQALANQIDTRASATNTDKKTILDNKGGSSTIQDPILKGLVDQYQAVLRDILGLAAVSVAPAAPAATEEK